MGAAGRFFWAPHAVHRARERLWPTLTYDQALARLIDASGASHFVRAQGNGDLWRAPRPWRFRFIVGRSSGGGLPAVVTVLSPHDRWRAR